MNSIDLLGVAFGLAMLSGLNLYLTVFASGMAIRLQWITLDGHFQQLGFLSNNWILGVSGVFLLLEFFADKIPWVDTLWDALHTVIRPLGGAFLATQTLGDASPTFLTIVGLMAGTMSFATHSAKAGTRIVANGSPEPFTNIGLSLGEDLAVVGGLSLLHFNPVLALVVFLLVLLTTLYFAPKLYHAVKAKVWLAFRKLNLPAMGRGEEGLSDELSSRAEEGFAEHNLLGEKVLWAVPCIARKGPGLAANHFGTLIATVEEPTQLYFIGESKWRRIRQTLELAGGEVERIPGFLFDEVRLSDATGKRRYSLAFDRARSRVVEEMTDSIRNRLAVSQEVALAT
jgi:hypothetical protein